MLVIRLSGEIIFVNAERELAKHQSGIQCGIFDYQCFILPEKYNCPTHMNDDVYLKFQDAQHSEYFGYKTPLEPCSNERYEVTCWIKWSYMKRKAYVFMYNKVLISRKRIQSKS